MPGQGPIHSGGPPAGARQEPPFAGLLDNEAGAPLAAPPPLPMDDPREAFRKRSAMILRVGFVCMLGGLYIACSTGLIAFNKYLMHEDRFPFSAVLVLLHTFVGTGLCLMLYFIKPSLFPSLTDPAKKVTIDKELILKGCVPIAFFFSVQLVLSNTAYLHSSVAFLQMLKEANLVLVYVLSLMAALESFSWQNCAVLGVVLFATTLTIHGELNFSLLGFAIQGSSQFFECCKIVLQGLLLSSRGKKLDPLTYVLLVMPVCFVFLGGFLSLTLIVPMPAHLLLHPTWQQLAHWAPMLALNACLAFALNVAIAWFIKECSPVAFILAGIIKDAMIVVAGALLFEEIVSILQTIGFVFQLCAVLLWSLMKTFPQKFEAGIFAGLHSIAFQGFEDKAPGSIAAGMKGYSAIEQQSSKCDHKC